MRVGPRTILNAARSAYKAGLCILPVAADGSKRPDVRTWTRYQRERPTSEQMRAFQFERRHGFGMIAGLVSGRRGAWDFDCPNTYRAFVAAADASGLGEVVQRIETGYCDETPAGGRRWIVAYPEIVNWRDVTLARRRGGDRESTIKTLIELPTFAILAPSHGPTHQTGRPYVRLAGGFTTIATVTAGEHEDLVALARTFDTMPRPLARDGCPRRPSGDRPGDVFNRCATWPEILEPAGWRQVFERGGVAYWRRPGKTHGVSATTNLGGHDQLYVFTSSTPFEPERCYSKFAAQATLRHGGDFAAAARGMAALGDSAQAPTISTTAPPMSREMARRSDARPVLVRLQDVRAEPVTWLWPGRLAAGKLALLIGDPGLGKSWITLDLAARISTGRAMPDKAPPAPPGDVILLVRRTALRTRFGRGWMRSVPTSLASITSLCSALVRRSALCSSPIPPRSSS